MPLNNQSSLLLLPAQSVKLTPNRVTVDVTVPGTPVQIIVAETLVYSFNVAAKVDNTGNIYIGFSNVDKDDSDTQLSVLGAGYSQARTALPGAVIDMSIYYIDADVADEGVVVEYWTA